MTTYLGKSCSFGLPRVPFVNCRQFMYLVISLLVLRAGYGIWLYQFLIIAYLFTFLYYNSFLPSTLRQWNNLFIETRQLNSQNSFKCFLKEDKRTVPKYYFYGVRKAQILHTRLRMGCSSLNLDLFLKNITDSPMCQCGSIENTQHFFFHCNFYQRQHTILLNSAAIYHTPTLNLFLNGDPSLSKAAINEGIFKHVHEYILDSKRF